MASPDHNWGWNYPERHGGPHFLREADDADYGSVTLLDHEDLPLGCLEPETGQEQPGEPALGQLSLMISSRLEQALEVRRLEEQLTELRAQLDLAIEVYRAAASREASKDLARTWPGYLFSLLVDGPLARDQVVRATNLWETLRKATGNLASPHAAALEDGRFSMAWDKSPHHFEVELQSGGLFDWFYLDRSTDRIEGEQDLPVGYISGPMIELLGKAAL